MAALHIERDNNWYSDQTLEEENIPEKLFPWKIDL